MSTGYSVNYETATLGIYDYNKNKVSTLYTPGTNNTGQAYAIKMQHDGSGWKEISFSLPMRVNGEDNPLAAHLINEYLIKFDDEKSKDWFIISEPRIDHNTPALTINVQCNHVSSRLRTKKLYLVFDDTNGIGKCKDLAEIILSGTGWSVGVVDVFLEPDGVTEKVRTLTSNGKEGAYQLLTKLCDLFNARPIFNGDTNTVDIRAFSPYSVLSVAEGETPTLHDPESLVELCYTKSMSGVTRTLNTENLITRLYVEGDFGDDGYVGIEGINPTGMNFLLNFDYFKATGLFTPEHQIAVDTYLTEMTAHRLAAKNATNDMSSHETELMKLWGTANYGIYKINSHTVDNLTVSYTTSLSPVKPGENEYLVVDRDVVVSLSDNKIHRAKITVVNGDVVTIVPALEAGMTPVDLLVYGTLASGSIGGKEAAVDAAEKVLKDLQNRVGDNLIANSDVVITSTGYLVNTYRLTDPFIQGTQYTVQVWGEVNNGQQFAAWANGSATNLGELVYDATKRVHSLTFTCPAITAGHETELRIYSYPSATATSATVQKVKLEFGGMPTPWSPAENSSNSALIQEYIDRIRGLNFGTEDSPGIHESTLWAISRAKFLQLARDAYDAAVASINAVESAFMDAMGDMLRDGYWQDNSYIVGQEEALFKDAVDTHAVMARPVASYTLALFHMVGMDAAPVIRAAVNTPVHIIDDDAGINAWGFIDQIVFAVDMPYNTTMRISTEESRFAKQSFSQVLSKIAETAKDVRAKQGVFARAALINEAGKISTEALDGVINVEVNRILSTTSNYHTDEKGNLVFVSQDGLSAMMLTGEGFMIANGRKTDGDWDWRSFGSGRGFSADEITAGTMRAGIVRILGTEQFYWDADNIYIIDPTNPRRQIRLGRFDGVNYGIGFTQDDGATWVSAFGFDGINLNYSSIDVSQVVGLDGIFLTKDEADGTYETITNVGAINSSLQDLASDIRQNIQFTGAGIIIQQVGTTSGFSSRFTSTALEFYQGSDPIAWFENRTLNVEHVFARNQLTVGKLIWHVASDNSVAVKWSTA